MAIIRIKRVETLENPTLKPGELGVIGNNMLFGRWQSADGNPISATKLANQNASNTFSAKNVFKNDSDANSSVEFQNAAGTIFYKSLAGRLQTALNFTFNDNDLVNKKYVDDNIKAADAMILKGTVNASTGLITSSDANINGKYLKGGTNLLGGYRVGWTFKVSVAGTLTGIGIMQIGDMVVAMNDAAPDFATADWHAFQTNVDFSTLGTNIAKLNSGDGLVGSSAGGVASIVSYEEVKESLGIAWGDIGGAAPYADKDHTHFDLVLEKTSSDAGQAALSLFEELNGATGATIKNGVKFFHQANGMGQYLEIARTGSGVEFNSDAAIYFNNPFYIDTKKVLTEGDYSRASSTLTGATVFSDIVVANGIVTDTKTRSLTASSIGAEPTITTKGTAFNKNFGTTTGTVAEGNHTHTASDVGAVPTSRTINGKALSSNISLTASDVGAVPTSRTINSKALTSNITLTASDVSAVPTSRTINSKALTSNITLSASDVGAKPNFTENNAFNKNFGTEAGTVAEGNHTHFGLVLEHNASDAGQAALSLFEELDSGIGYTIKNGVRFFRHGDGSGQYLEIARTGSRVEFNSDATIYFNNRIDAEIDCGTSW